MWPSPSGHFLTAGRFPLQSNQRPELSGAPVHRRLEAGGETASARIMTQTRGDRKYSHMTRELQALSEAPHPATLQ
jgi:hypothetical protein